MSYVGRNKLFKKNSVIFTAFVVATIIIILFSVVFLLIGIYFNKTSIYYNKYHNEMYTLLEVTDTFTLADIVDFEFDKVYVASITEVYLGEEYFLEKLNASTTVDIPILDSGNHNRLLFIKDNVIVYDFVYPLEEIYFEDDVIWIYPNELIKIISKMDKMIKLGLE